MIVAIPNSDRIAASIRSGTEEPVMRSRTATTAAIILSLAAGAPTASARPADIVPASHQSPATVYSRPDKTMTPVTAPYVGAVAQSPTPVYSRPDKSMLPTSATAGGDFSAPAAPPVVARVQAPQSGFDWGDAGIGAAGLVLSVIGIGGAFAVSQRRRRTTALPN
jgi:hypothetical protein